MTTLLLAVGLQLTTSGTFALLYRRYSHRHPA